MTDSSQKRRFQFRLRTLLIGVTLVAILCPFGARLLRHWEREREIDEIERQLRQAMDSRGGRIELLTPLRRKQLQE